RRGSKGAHAGTVLHLEQGQVGRREGPPRRHASVAGGALGRDTRSDAAARYSAFFALVRNWTRRHRSEAVISAAQSNHCLTSAIKAVAGARMFWRVQAWRRW